MKCVDDDEMSRQVKDEWIQLRRVCYTLDQSKNSGKGQIGIMV